MQKTTYPKPLLKWIGGKTQLLEKVLSKFPTVMTTYHEPFVGGGSVLFAVLELRRIGIFTIQTVRAYDINSKLITFYKHIQTHKEELYQLLQTYKNIYNSITTIKIPVEEEDKTKKRKLLQQLRKPSTIEEAIQSREAYYYWLREQFNHSVEGSLTQSALLWVLNKTDFRGMYRESSNGFNVPFGNYKGTVSFIVKEDLDRIHNLLQGVVFECVGFDISLSNVSSGDFVYTDPPYVPELSTSFVDYVEDGFDKKKHDTLFSLLRKLPSIGVGYVCSNSNIPWVCELFSNEASIETVDAKRSIHYKKPQTKTKEIIIWNVNYGN